MSAQSLYFATGRGWLAGAWVSLALLSSEAWAQDARGAVELRGMGGVGLRLANDATYTHNENQWAVLNGLYPPGLLFTAGLQFGRRDRYLLELEANGTWVRIPEYGVPLDLSLSAWGVGVNAGLRREVSAFEVDGMLCVSLESTEWQVVAIAPADLPIDYATWDAMMGMKGQLSWRGSGVPSRDARDPTRARVLPGVRVSPGVEVKLDGRINPPSGISYSGGVLRPYVRATIAFMGSITLNRPILGRAQRPMAHIHGAHKLAGVLTVVKDTNCLSSPEDAIVLPDLSRGGQCP